MASKWERLWPKSAKFTSEHKLFSCERSLEEALNSRKFVEGGGNRKCVVRKPLGYRGAGHKACPSHAPFELYCLKKTEKNYRVLDFMATMKKGKPVHKYFTTKEEGKSFSRKQGWQGFPVIPVTKRK